MLAIAWPNGWTKLAKVLREPLGYHRLNKLNVFFSKIPRATPGTSASLSNKYAFMIENKILLVPSISFLNIPVNV